ncbi:hypothetical protein PGT21_015789, partial [Puccinia graminis f. sp. tritici]
MTTANHQAFGEVNDRTWPRDSFRSAGPNQPICSRSKKRSHSCFISQDSRNESLDRLVNPIKPLIEVKTRQRAY